MKTYKLTAIAFATMLLASCTASYPVLVTENKPLKTGTAEATVILGFIRPMHMDLSIQKAAKNGGITKVASVDFQVQPQIFITTYKTVVTGE